VLDERDLPKSFDRFVATNASGAETDEVEHNEAYHIFGTGFKIIARLCRDSPP
jgi:hypothetical protein